jgi:hypothetical protein
MSLGSDESCGWTPQLLTNRIFILRTPMEAFSAVKSSVKIMVIHIFYLCSTSQDAFSCFFKQCCLNDFPTIISTHLSLPLLLIQECTVTPFLALPLHLWYGAGLSVPMFFLEDSYKRCMCRLCCVCAMAHVVPVTWLPLKPQVPGISVWWHHFIQLGFFVLVYDDLWTYRSYLLGLFT